MPRDPFLEAYIKGLELKVDLILLLLRVAFGGMLLFGHGLPKLLTFSENSTMFYDPFGIGPQISMGLAIFAEVFCSAAVIFGVLTRFAAIPVVVTMLTAFIMVHGNDPWPQRELALCFAVPFICLIIMGGGRFALDGLRRQST